MKFSAAIVGLSLLCVASGFAPNSHPRQYTALHAPENTITRIGTIVSSTELGARPKKGAKKLGNSVNLVSKARNEMNKKAKLGDSISEKEVRALFELWNSALATGDSRIVAARYAKKPVLLPTVSDQPRTDYESVKDYFDSFLLKKPQGKIVDGKIHIGNGWASDMGIYEFTMGATGDKVKARYTYNYIKGKP